MKKNRKIQTAKKISELYKEFINSKSATTKSISNEIYPINDGATHTHYKKTDGDKILNEIGYVASSLYVGHIYFRTSAKTKELIIPIKFGKNVILVQLYNYNNKFYCNTMVNPRHPSIYTTKMFNDTCVSIKCSNTIFDFIYEVSEKLSIETLHINEYVREIVASCITQRLLEYIK